MICNVRHRAHIEDESGMTRSVIAGDQFCGPDGERLVAVPARWVCGGSDEGQEENHGEVNGDAAVVQIEEGNLEEGQIQGATEGQTQGETV